LFEDEDADDDDDRVGRLPRHTRLGHQLYENKCCTNCHYDARGYRHSLRQSENSIRRAQLVESPYPDTSAALESIVGLDMVELVEKYRKMGTWERKAEENKVKILLAAIATVSVQEECVSRGRRAGGCH
jgi:hypothetical protein